MPWALLVAGSAASLAANVAVAEPTMIGRVIAAWPSFSLIAAYELLMRQVRAAAGRPWARAGTDYLGGARRPSRVGLERARHELRRLTGTAELATGCSGRPGSGRWLTGILTVFSPLAGRSLISSAVTNDGGGWSSRLALIVRPESMCGTGCLAALPNADTAA
jgi:hypothetical protein